MDKMNTEQGMSYYEHIKNYACTKDETVKMIITDAKGDLGFLKQAGYEISTHDVSEYQVYNPLNK